jgi:hypothetical protein
MYTNEELDLNFLAEWTLLVCGVPCGQDMLGHYQI